MYGNDQCESTAYKNKIQKCYLRSTRRSIRYHYSYLVQIPKIISEQAKRIEDCRFRFWTLIWGVRP